MAVLRSLSKDRAAAFLRVGLFTNELNWLVRLLLIARIPNEANEAERRATLSLALLIVKLLAGKVHEGWLKLQSEITPLIAHSFTADGRQAVENLRQRLAKGSMIHKPRNEYAFHYSAQLSIDDLEALPLGDDEMVAYMSQHHGHNLVFVSELAAINRLTAITNELDPGKSFSVVMQEVVEVAGLYSDYVVAVLIALLGDDVIESLTTEEMPAEESEENRRERIFFFELPPPD
ncbi:hypothetical protein C9I57_11330 [Trinickia symbiotica]|uniref:Uncharacterized protein n=2 Tax=Trinickia symbiotica TaxID=863227 RepID=A0A2T3XVA9_9BURK|nr:hypothetical protein C9I57_11330 [Trinickia symbiotica]